jgi:hypothetical protein
MDFKTEAQAVTDSYASLLKVKVPEAKSASLVLKNTHGSKSLTFKILVSNDPQGALGSWDALDLDSIGTTEGTLTYGSIQSWDLPLYHSYDVQVANAVAEQASEASAWMHVTG